MKKFWRTITSPKLLFALLIIAEILILVGGYVFLEGYLAVVLESEVENAKTLADSIKIIVILVVRLALSIVALIVFYRIINREENPEYKIPWITFLFLFPAITLTFYFVFVRTRMRRKDAKIVIPTMKYLDGKAKEHESIEKANEEEIEPNCRGIFSYLHKTTRLFTSKNNRLTYFKNGEEFFPSFIEDLKKAKQFIFLEFFIIAEGKWYKKTIDVLKEKASEGVDVRIIFDDIGCNGTIPDNFVRQMKKAGIKAYPFHPITPILSNIINNRDHRKIVIIDHQIGYTGGMNLADEYANDKKRFGYWKDTMIKIEGEGIKDLIVTFLQNHDLCTHEITDYSLFTKGDDYPHFEDKGSAFFFGDTPGPYDDNEQVGEQNYINMLNVATKRVDISTPYLICTYPLIRALQSAAKRGVEVNLIVPGIPDKKIVYWMAKCQFHLYLEAGIHVYIYTPGFNHQKGMLVDDKLASVGTINFDFRSLTHHFEDAMVIYDAPCLKDIKKDFEEMISVSKEVPVDFKANAFQRFVSGVFKIFRVLL